MGGLVGFGREVRLCWILRRGRGDGQSQRSRLGSDQGGWNLRIAGSCTAGNRKGSRAGIAVQASAVRLCLVALCKFFKKTFFYI